MASPPSDTLSASSTYTLNNGVKIPIIGFGTYQLAPGSQSQKAALSALQAGYRLIDTAALYANEKDVAMAIAQSGLPRSSLFVTTKLWNSDQSRVEEAFLRSQSNLGPAPIARVGSGEPTAHHTRDASGVSVPQDASRPAGRPSGPVIDLYLLHWPVEKTRLSAYGRLERLLASRAVRAIGVSNFTVRHLEELLSHSSVVPAVNQVEFSPFLYQKELLQFCQRHGIRLQAYCPLIRGQRARHPQLVELAAKHHKSWAQILLRWNLQHGVIPLPRSKTAERIKENSNLFDFSLSPNDMKTLDSLNEDFRVSWNPEEIK